MEEFPTEVSQENQEESTVILPEKKEKYSIISFWKIFVLTLSFYILVYMIPTYVSLILMQKGTDKQISLFNKNADSYEELSPDSLHVEIGKDVKYDEEFIRFIFKQNNLNFEPFEKRLGEPHNELWANVIFGKLVNNTITQFAINNISNNVRIFQILHISLIIVGLFIFYLIYMKILKPIESEKHFLTTYLGSNKKNKYLSLLFFIIIIALIILLDFLTEGFDLSGLGTLNRIQVIQDHLSFELESFFSVIYGLSLLYFTYLFILIGYDIKKKWYAKIAHFLACLFNFLIFAINYSSLSDTYKDIVKMNQIFFSDKLPLFVGIERYLAFAMNTLLWITSLIYLIYYFYEFLRPGKNQLRIEVMIKNISIILYATFVLIISGIKWSILHDIVTQQYTNTLRLNAIYLAGETSASVYQYYHTQKDAGETVIELPDDLFNSFSELINTEYTKTWDGDKLEFYFEFESSYPDSLETIHYSFEAETAEKEHKTKRIVKPI